MVHFLNKFLATSTIQSTEHRINHESTSKIESNAYFMKSYFLKNQLNQFFTMFTSHPHFQNKIDFSLL